MAALAITDVPRLFWEHDGYKVLGSAAAGVGASMDSLADYMRKRASVEEAHAKALKKLPGVKVKDVPQTMDSCLSALVALSQHADQCAVGHTAAAGQLRKLATALTECASELKGKRKQAEAVCSEINQRDSAMKEAAAKAKKEYYKQCEVYLKAESTDLRHQVVSEQPRRRSMMRSPKRETVVVKKETEREKADTRLNTYKNRVLEAQEWYSTFVEQRICTHEELVSLLSKGLDKIKETLFQYLMILTERHEHETSTEVHANFGMINRTQDVLAFGTTEGTGSNMPKPVTFEPFEHGVLGGEHEAFAATKKEPSPDPEEHVDGHGSENGHVDYYEDEDGVMIVGSAYAGEDYAGDPPPEEHYAEDHNNAREEPVPGEDALCEIDENHENAPEMDLPSGPRSDRGESLAWAHIDHEAVLEWLHDYWEDAPADVVDSFRASDIDGRTLYRLDEATLNTLHVATEHHHNLLAGVRQLKSVMVAEPNLPDDYPG